MTSLVLRNLKIDLIGGMAAMCWPAEFIAKAVMLNTVHTRPSLDVLEAALLNHDLPYGRETNVIGDWIQMGDWFVTCRRDRWCIWSHEAFALVMPLPTAPAASAALAA